MTGQSCVPNFNSILASQGHIKEVLISISSFEPVIPLANANSQLISIVDLNQLTGPPQCKLFEQKQLSLSLNSHRSVPNSNLPAYLHPGWASPKCKVTSLVLTKLLPPLNCTPPLTITDPIAAFTGLLWNNIEKRFAQHPATTQSRLSKLQLANLYYIIQQWRWVLQ